MFPRYMCRYLVIELEEKRKAKKEKAFLTQQIVVPFLLSKKICRNWRV